MDITAAPAPSPAEQAVIDRFEAAPYPAEVLLSHLGGQMTWSAAPAGENESEPEADACRVTVTDAEGFVKREWEVNIPNRSHDYGRRDA